MNHDCKQSVIWTLVLIMDDTDDSDTSDIDTKKGSIPFSESEAKKQIEIVPDKEDKGVMGMVNFGEKNNFSCPIWFRLYVLCDSHRRKNKGQMGWIWEK